MFSPRLIAAVLASLVFSQVAAAQTVVNSTFVNRYPNNNYSDPNNWSPAEVPNNNAAKLYNVNIGYTIEVDTDATVSNLMVTGMFTGLNIRENSLVVTGATTDQMEHGSISIQSSATAEARFDAGTFSKFSNNTLSGSYSMFSFGSPATLQFKGAAVSTLSNGFFGFYGPLARVVDEFGNDALLNLARLDSGATLSISNHSRVTNAPFSNEGRLSISQGPAPTNFTAAVSLTNFDPASRTLTGGTFSIGGYDLLIPPAELRFKDADIVNLASAIELIGSGARIADLTGNDGLRNFARILPAGSLLLSQRAFAIPGQFQNDGSLTLYGKTTFTVNGALTNFDPASQTLSGGVFVLSQDSQLKFPGADIVHNGAKLSLADGAMITDLAGNDALRNFRDNLNSGEFIVGNGTQFTAPGDFTNAGKVETSYPFITPREFGSPGVFTVPSGFRYAQSSGATINEGILNAEHIDINGGTVQGRGTFGGNVTLTNATIIPFSPTIIQGNLTLSAGSHFRFHRHAEPEHEITGQVTLAGTLEVDIPSDAFVSSTAFLTVLKSALPLTGTFSNAPNGARIATTDGKGSVVVVYGQKAVYITGYHAEPPPAQLLNISSRAFLSRADDDPFGDRAVIIGGFIITGTTGAKDVVLRGLGPSLTASGLTAVLADPILELRASNGALLATNDNWKDTQPNEIVAAGLAPNDDREAALRITLQPGTYTVVIKEKNGLAGTGLVEIYDFSQNSDSKLANISTRGFTDASDLLIGGIIAAGDGQANADIVVRAIGPQLRRHGILNALEDPTLEVHDSQGSVVAFNDDWITNFNQVESTGLAPFHSSESALVLSLPSGNYTAIVRAKGDSGGVALVEFYDLRR